MSILKRTFTSEEETASFGTTLGSILRQGDVVCLLGALRAGKTTLARAAITAATGHNEIPSPTFSLVELYENDHLTICHFDLYRLESPEEVWELGLEEAFDSAACLIEWPEKIEQNLPSLPLTIALALQSDARLAKISAPGEWHRRLHHAGIG